ncbi:MAG: helix-turn-helix transcriptional regulator [Proteobacteria bacterium]|jgi:DNA-binding XRE family transcriptional regulator|nr:helix-turn-helix transcriptional regulator [Pseudomonadota bacterium]
MARHLTFQELRAQRDPESRVRVDTKIAKNRVRYAFIQALRKMRKLTQAELAEALNISQKNVSAMENRDDMLLSTLQRVVEAMGGRLILHVQFDDSEEIAVEVAL